MQELDTIINECLKLANYEQISKRGSGKIYCNTNENLKKILKPEFIEGKNVLSVMASSDQVFTSYYYDAASVETFDSNIFAYYFFFLKKWTLLASKKYYISACNKDLFECIEYYDKRNIEEKNAYYFWKNVLNNVNGSLYYSHLFYKYYPFIVPYSDDIDKLVDKIIYKIPKYYNFNLYETNKFSKTYDTIILSNILEYLYEEDRYTYQKKLNIVKNNLLSLTHPGSLIISSNILDYDYKGNEVLEKYFEYDEGEEDKNIRFNQKVPLYYTYTRK